MIKIKHYWQGNSLFLIDFTGNDSQGSWAYCYVKHTSFHFSHVVEITYKQLDSWIIVTLIFKGALVNITVTVRYCTVPSSLVVLVALCYQAKGWAVLPQVNTIFGLRSAHRHIRVTKLLADVVVKIKCKCESSDHCHFLYIYDMLISNIYNVIWIITIM